ncbi:MAG: PAS domain S-box protein [Terriglobia bacterium]
MKQRTPSIPEQLARENSDLRARLAEAEGNLRALLTREVDAVVVATDQGERIFTLQGAESVYRLLIEDLNEGAVTLTAEGMILYCNRRFAEMLRTPLEQVIGSSIHAWIAPADRMTFEGLLRSGDQGSRREGVRLCASDGRNVPAYLSVSSFQSHADAAAFCLVATDLTEQKRNEAVAACETLSRAVLEQASEAVLICDENGEVIRANAKSFALFGPDVLGQVFADKFSILFADGSRLSPAAARRGERFQEVEVRFERQGEAAHWLLSAGPLEGPLNQNLGYLLTLTDVTALKRMAAQILADQAELRRLLEEANRSRRALLSVVEDQQQAEKALRESERRFRQLANSLPQLVWSCAPDGPCDFLSQQWVDYTGIPEQSQLGFAWLEQLHPEDRERAMTAWNTAVAAGSDFHAEFRIRRKDGAFRWFDTRAVRVCDAAGRTAKWFGSNTDVTDRKQLEDQLRQAQKMEAVGRLAGGVAHDFNNLLTVINGYGGLLLNRLEEGSSFRRYVEEVCKAGDRAASLTRQLLTFSRQQVLEPRVLDLNGIVANIEKMLRRVIGEDIELATVLAPDLGAIKADPSQLEQVLLNLAVNSRDAMPRGGKLTIRTSNCLLREPFGHRHGELPPGNYAVLEVSDTGCGMNAETEAHLFEPFFTTKEQGKGTGLGLAIVYGVVKQSGGSVSVASEEGKGTTFTIYFPHAGESAVLEEAVESRRVLSRGSETILLVEDEERVRSLVHSVLEASGYVVLAAKHGQEALAVMKEHPKPVQLVVTDVVLPEMSGPELVAQLAPLKPDLKILYMSGYTEDAVQIRGLISPGVAYLQKPFTPEKLTHRVREVLDTPQTMQ